VDVTEMAVPEARPERKEVRARVLRFWVGGRG
jgi:hypothetical protein